MFIVRLMQTKFVDHCVVVDACRSVIIDSANEFPVRLTEVNLRLCAGDDATRVRVSEVRELIDQTNSTSA